jgi:drug/metabolite transporter (DMT)-like permease
MAVLVWLLLCLIWGTTWLFIKLGLQDLPPLTFAGIRFVIAVAVLLLVIAVRKAPPPASRSDLKLLALTGFLAFSMNYGLLFWGEQHVSSGLAALLQSTIPLFGLVLGHYKLSTEPMSLPKLCGVLLGMLGVGLIFADQLQAGGRMALEGSAAIIIGAFCVAYSNVHVKARGTHLDPAWLAAGQMIFGLIPLLIGGVLFEGNPLRLRWTGLAVASLLYLALVGSSLAFVLYYWLVRHMAVSTTMLISLVIPIVAVLVGMAVLGEQVTWKVASGGVVVLAGISMNLLGAARHRSPAGTRPDPATHVRLGGDSRPLAAGVSKCKQES